MSNTLFSSSIATLVVVAALIYGRLTPDPPEIALTGQVDHILIDKSDRRMIVYRDGKALKGYDIALGFAPLGDKVREGDGKTPEGVFRINRKNPNSKFHLSVGIDYPLKEDLQRAKAGGYSAGGDIFLHGQPAGIKGTRRIISDWTAGCIAVSNAEMNELFPAISVGTTVEIRP